MAWSVKTRSAVHLASIGLVWLVRPLLAQSLPSTRPELPPDAVVRVETLNGERIQGRFEQYRADSLLVSRAIGPTGVPLGTLSRVWVKGRATKTGMLVGGLVGVPFGVLAGGAACEFYRQQASNIDCGPHYAVATALGAAVGVGLGALVGQFIPKWHLRFRLGP